jgi:hypothetical protein
MGKHFIDPEATLILFVGLRNRRTSKPRKWKKNKIPALPFSLAFFFPAAHLQHQQSYFFTADRQWQETKSIWSLKMFCCLAHSHSALRKT